MSTTTTIIILILILILMGGIGWYSYTNSLIPYFYPDPDMKGFIGNWNFSNENLKFDGKTVPIVDKEFIFTYDDSLKQIVSDYTKNNYSRKAILSSTSSDGTIGIMTLSTNINLIVNSTNIDTESNYIFHYELNGPNVIELKLQKYELKANGAIIYEGEKTYYDNEYSLVRS